MRLLNELLINGEWRDCQKMLKLPPCGRGDGFLRTVQLLRHAGAVDAGRTHLCEHLVQPLQRPVQVQLYPAGGAGHGLTPERHGEIRLSTTANYLKKTTWLRTDN